MDTKKTVTQKVLEYMYNISKQPVLLKDLLISNRQYKEGMLVEPGRLGFRLILSRAYFLYISVFLIALFIITAITHKALADLDAHISIVGGMIITAVAFMGFNFFRAKMRDEVTKELINRGWKVHFPFFSYEEYGEKINEIFEQSLKDEVSKRDLERYILDKLTD